MRRYPISLAKHETLKVLLLYEQNSLSFIELTINKILSSENVNHSLLYSTFYRPYPALSIIISSYHLLHQYNNRKIKIMNFRGAL